MNMNKLTNLWNDKTLSAGKSTKVTTDFNIFMSENELFSNDEINKGPLIYD